MQQSVAQVDGAAHDGCGSVLPFEGSTQQRELRLLAWGKAIQHEWQSVQRRSQLLRLHHFIYAIGAPRHGVLLVHMQLRTLLRRARAAATARLLLLEGAA